MLQLTSKNGVFYADSRDVAEMVEKRHDHLLRDIKGYCDILTDPNLGALEFFIESNYTDAKGEIRPCFLITRKGCDMIANKMTGEKGVLFTAAYINIFYEMEKKLKPRDSYAIDDSIERAERWIEEQKERIRLLEDNQRKDEAIFNVTKESLQYTHRQQLDAIVKRFVESEKFSPRFLGQNMYSRIWDLVYRLAYDRLGINLKSRKRGRKESIISTATDAELLEIYRLMACEAHVMGIDVLDIEGGTYLLN